MVPPVFVVSCCVHGCEWPHVCVSHMSHPLQRPFDPAKHYLPSGIHGPRLPGRLATYTPTRCFIYFLYLPNPSPLPLPLFRLDGSSRGRDRCANPSIRSSITNAHSVTSVSGQTCPPLLSDHSEWYYYYRPDQAPVPRQAHPRGEGKGPPSPPPARLSTL